ncbi:MAG: hypothetical protein MZV63_09750 [Marinilabiliales bacterium]|nr:hypothetical protein [Marinilabiliales bacterium]
MRASVARPRPGTRRRRRRGRGHRTSWPHSSAGHAGPPGPRRSLVLGRVLPKLITNLRHYAPDLTCVVLSERLALAEIKLLIDLGVKATHRPGQARRAPRGRRPSGSVRQARRRARDTGRTRSATRRDPELARAPRGGTARGAGARPSPRSVRDARPRTPAGPRSPRVVRRRLRGARATPRARPPAARRPRRTARVFLPGTRPTGLRPRPAGLRPRPDGLRPRPAGLRPCPGGLRPRPGESRPGRACLRSGPSEAAEAVDLLAEQQVPVGYHAHVTLEVFHQHLSAGIGVVSHVTHGATPFMRGSMEQFACRRAGGPSSRNHARRAPTSLSEVPDSRPDSATIAPGEVAMKALLSSGAAKVKLWDAATGGTLALLFRAAVQVRGAPTGTNQARLAYGEAADHRLPAHEHEVHVREGGDVGEGVAVDDDDVGALVDHQRARHVEVGAAVGAHEQRGADAGHGLDHLGGREVGRDHPLSLARHRLSEGESHHRVRRIGAEAPATGDARLEHGQGVPAPRWRRWRRGRERLGGGVHATRWSGRTWLRCRG